MTTYKTISVYSFTIAWIIVFQLLCTATFAFGFEPVQTTIELVEQTPSLSSAVDVSQFDVNHFDDSVDNQGHVIYNLSSISSLLNWRTTKNSIPDEKHAECFSFYHRWTSKALPKVFNSLFS